jgi:hypothetical protein
LILKADQPTDPKLIFRFAEPQAKLKKSVQRSDFDSEVANVRAF